MRYWIWFNDLVQGPFEPEELLSLRAFNEELLVCMEGREEWLPAGRVADLSTVVEQLKARRSEPLVPAPPPPPKRPPVSGPLQGEFFAESPGQKTLLETDDELKGPYAYRAVEDVPEPSPTYFLGQATMPFHFTRQPLSMPVFDAPRRAPPKIVMPAQPIILESPVREEELSDPLPVPLQLLQEDASLAPLLLDKPFEPEQKLEWLPWILGVILALVSLGGTGYWLLDRANTHSAIVEANRLEHPRPMVQSPSNSLSSINSSSPVLQKEVGSAPTPMQAQAMGSPLSHSVSTGNNSGETRESIPAEKKSSSSTFKKAIQATTAIFNAMSSLFSHGASASSSLNSQSRNGSNRVRGPQKEAGPASSPIEARSSPVAMPAAVPGMAAENIGTVPSSNSGAMQGSVPAEKNSSKSTFQKAMQTTMALLNAMSSLLSHGASATAGGSAMPVPGMMPAAAPGIGVPNASLAYGRASGSMSTRTGPHSSTKATLRKKRRVSHTPPHSSPKKKTYTARHPLLKTAASAVVRGTSAAASAHPSGSVVAMPAAGIVAVPSAASPSAAPAAAGIIAGAKSASAAAVGAMVPGMAAAAPASATDIPVVDVSVPLAPRAVDPWAGRQNEAIKFVMATTLPKSKVTIGEQARTMLQQMHEKELIHAADTGERLYLPDKMAWAALQEEGSRYRVYLNFMASQANGERVQARSYQFVVDLKQKTLHPDDATTQEDILSQPAALTFKHNPMATDIDSILGGVDTYNKHGVQLMIVKNNRSNRDDRKKIETALATAQNRVKRAVIYFRRTYTEKALQNIAKAYNFVELIKG